MEITMTLATTSEVKTITNFQLAKMMSDSQLVPKAYQGKPADVMIAMEMAKFLNVSVIEILSGLFMVGGKPSFTSQFAISLANRKGPFASGINYRSAGDSLEKLVVTAYGIHKTSGEEMSATVSMEMARKEGWTAKNPKYQSMPEHMLRYRAATFLIRQYCPEVLMGHNTDDELKDITQDTPHHISDLNTKILSQTEKHIGVEIGESGEKITRTML